MQYTQNHNYSSTGCTKSSTPLTLSAKLPLFSQLHLQLSTHPQPSAATNETHNYQTLSPNSLKCNLISKQPLNPLYLGHLSSSFLISFSSLPFSSYLPFSSSPPHPSPKANIKQKAIRKISLPIYPKDDVVL